MHLDEVPRQDLRADVEHLFASNAKLALFLDIDGTLLDVALTPSTVRVPPTLPELLDMLSIRLDGALAIITGRPIAEADKLLSPAKLIAAGVHGAEMRFLPEGVTENLTPAFSAALQEEIKNIVRGLPGVVYEDKGGGVALHYRLAPEYQSSLMMLLDELAPRYPNQFTIWGGRKVVELLPVGFSKGRALRKFVSMPQFADRIPIMIGDDISDVAAFREAEEINGFGLKVAGEHFSKEEASFQGPADVLDWLKKLARSGRN
jgi:trehalose 6-phosphate phosphatase